jgi:hypothetical protein
MTLDESGRRWVWEILLHLWQRKLDILLTGI